MLALNDNLGGNGGSSSGNSITLAWDGVDDVLSEATSSASGPAYNSSVTYKYNNAGLVTGLTESQNGNSVSFLYCHDADDELHSIFYGSGVTCTSGNPLTALTYNTRRQPKEPD